MTRAVFLDRDGVINRPVVREGRPFPPTELSDFVWNEGVPDTLQELQRRGYQLLVCTNQPDVARGTQTRERVEQMHAHLTAQLPVAHVYACYHDDPDDCDCRKPRPGMLQRGAQDFALELGDCWMVGDRWRDIEAGHNAGCRTVFVDNGYAEVLTTTPDFTITNIRELLNIIK